MCYKCRHATDRSQTQEPHFVGHQEIQSNEFPGRLLRSQPVAKLGTELEQVQQDLSQPLPRNICVRKDKEAKAFKQELSTNMAKIQNLMAMKQKLENETNDIRKRVEAEAERDLAFSQMSQEQSSDTNHEIADQWNIDVLTRETAIKPICRYLHYLRNSVRVYPA